VQNPSAHIMGGGSHDYQNHMIEVVMTTEEI